ncbi:MAG: hypothetical protein JNM99_11460 [Verrucomicrobiaceae bacterium]|nr:hypothetical protein [Verrucomicrobiaceae bacterium]
MPSPNTSTSKFIPLGAVAILGLASCSMPADQAWRQIRQDGLIPYLMQGQADGAENPGALASNSKPAPSKPTVPAVAPTTPSMVSVPPPSQLASQSLPTAQSVPGLEGYVRSPFTNPPRLVDVRGMSAGSKVVCPYTRRPFLVPQGAQSTQAVASTTPAPAPAQPTLPTPQPEQPKPQTPATPPPSVPTKVAANTAPAPTPPPAPQVKPSPAPTTPAPSTPPSAPKPAASNELPFGSPIPGRPGFVNSPYAAKHQLVDVTGLPTGMEVKCPYTGKLFRVPPGANSAAPQTQKQ